MERKQLQKFLDSIKRDPATGCWNWQRGKDSNGYGRMFFNKKSHKTHRLSKSFFSDSEIAADAFVCHTCDNPACVNPEHLFISDNQGNMMDMSTKGRGKDQKLDAVTAMELKRKYATGEFLQTALAKEYNITPSAVRRILTGQSYGYLPKVMPQSKPHKKLTPELVTQIRVDYFTNPAASYTTLSRQHGLHHSTIADAILRNKHRGQ